jgi:hypothetical protein
VALENFCDRHWPCEYVKPGGGARCVNVRSGHGAKGHQGPNGRVLAVGQYQSNFSAEAFQTEFRQRVYFNLVRLLNKLPVASRNAESEEQAAAYIHRDSVMASFYKHVGGAERFISHSVCFSCLCSPPQHALPCGHIICTPCLEAYGKRRRRMTFELHGCPLHPYYWNNTQSWAVTVKPSPAGIRMLVLDG